MFQIHLGQYLLIALLSLVSIEPCQATRIAGRQLDHRHQPHPLWPSPGSLPEATGGVSSVAILNPFPWSVDARRARLDTAF